MKAVLTRVSQASVTVAGETVGRIDCPETGGVLALVGVSREDCEDKARTAAAVEKMARKIAELRMLDGEKSVTDTGAPVLVVSQFTLYGATARGRRPSWSAAAPAEMAEPVITELVRQLRSRDITVAEGRFGAMMEVSSVNQGPFTLLVET
ncbi:MULTISPECIES: D-aminoacyl-tRNA deacylase [unclassified Corynebacterium]|uniref:D-aminoacyl-tRNA deacylase n=1 Tax=unclassified Corynebacterium TaxID=2624378 RepID=UPI0034CD43E6